MVINRTNHIVDTLFPLSWQCEVEAQASVGIVACADGAAMQEHGILHDGQAQSCTAHLAASPFIHPVEAFKEAWQVFVGHTHAIVAEGEMPETLAVVVDCYLDGCAHA